MLGHLGFTRSSLGIFLGYAALFGNLSFGFVALGFVRTFGLQAPHDIRRLSINAHSLCKISQIVLSFVLDDILAFAACCYCIQRTTGKTCEHAAQCSFAHIQCNIKRCSEFRLIAVSVQMILICKAVKLAVIAVYDLVEDDICNFGQTFFACVSENSLLHAALEQRIHTDLFHRCGDSTHAYCVNGCIVVAHVFLFVQCSAGFLSEHSHPLKRPGRTGKQAVAKRRDALKCSIRKVFAVSVVQKRGCICDRLPHLASEDVRHAQHHTPGICLSIGVFAADGFESKLIFKHRRSRIHCTGKSAHKVHRETGHSAENLIAYALVCPFSGIGVPLIDSFLCNACIDHSKILVKAVHIVIVDVLQSSIHLRRIHLIQRIHAELSVKFRECSADFHQFYDCVIVTVFDCAEIIVDVALLYPAHVFIIGQLFAVHIEYILSGIQKASVKAAPVLLALNVITAALCAAFYGLRVIGPLLRFGVGFFFALLRSHISHQLIQIFLLGHALEYLAVVVLVILLIRILLKLLIHSVALGKIVHPSQLLLLRSRHTGHVDGIKAAGAGKCRIVILRILLLRCHQRIGVLFKFVLCNAKVIYAGCKVLTDDRGILVVLLVPRYNSAVVDRCTAAHKIPIIVVCLGVLRCISTDSVVVLRSKIRASLRRITIPLRLKFFYRFVRFSLRVAVPLGFKLFYRLFLVGSH